MGGARVAKGEPMSGTRHLPPERDPFIGRLHEEMARLRSAGKVPVSIDPLSPMAPYPHPTAATSMMRDAPLPGLGRTRPGLEARDSYRLEDFLQYHDEDFVRNTYRGLLRREPDVAGFASYLAALRSARLSKTEIIGRIRYSPEGRATGVAVRGLLFPFALRSLRRLPVLGRPIGIVQYVVRLPDIVRNHERLEATMFQRELDLGRQFDSALARLSNHFFAVAQHKAGQAQFDALTRIVESSLIDLSERIRLLDDGKADDERVTHLAERVFDDIERKAERHQLEALSESVEANLKGLSTRIQEVADGTLHRADLPDAMYVAFEDRFRGTREDIMQRVAVYLPVVRECQAGTANAPVLDIGCGRGEWLEVLAAAGFVARGVDSNPVMVAGCRARGLDVVQGDGIGYVGQLPSESLGMLSAIHVIEHMGFNDLVLLLDEARRVLRPGGMLVLETPNPENLVVGACNFYYDPTHRQPLPPEPMRHLTQARGFTGVEILRLHPATPPERATANADAWSAQIDALLYGPQDYSIIARNCA